MSREEFEQEDDQYHAMIMKYHWKHFWGTFEAKAKAIFGEGKEQKNNYAEQVRNDPKHQEAMKKLKALR